MGSKVLIRGRVDSSRGKGNLCFVVLRQRVSTVQCVVCKDEEVSKEMVKFAQDLHNESIVDLEATVLKAEQPVDSCTVRDLELRVSSVFVVSQAANLPVQVSDCSVPPAVFVAQKAAQKEIQDKIDALVKRQEAGEDVTAELTKLNDERAAVNKFIKGKWSIGVGVLLLTACHQ